MSRHLHVVERDQDLVDMAWERAESVMVDQMLTYDGSTDPFGPLLDAWEWAIQARPALLSGAAHELEFYGGGR